MGGRAVAILDHPRPTKAVLSLVKREAGILRGILGVAHMFDSAWSTGLARMLSLKYWLDSGREWALLRSTVSSQASISTSKPRFQPVSLDFNQ